MPAPNPTVRPKLADAYFDWEAEGTSSPDPSTGSTIAVPATSNWGPDNVVIELNSFDEYSPIFGDSDTALRRAVLGAFKGQAVGGRGGSGTVLARRQSTNAAAKATKTLQNTTPVAALLLTAIYTGTRANNLRATVQAGAVGGTNELLILDGALVVERYIHTAIDIAGLVAQINATSDWVTATLEQDGVALAAISGTAFAGGDNGAVLTGADWTETFTDFDRERWAAFAAYGLTDATIRAAIVAWIQQRNAVGLRAFGILGGAAGESLDTAIARSAAINDPNIINLGRGTLRLTDENRDCSTAEFVTRYAGARAWRGERHDDIYVRFADVEIVDGPSLDDQERALDGGVVVFSRDTNRTAPVFIREGVTSYTDDSQSPRDAEGNVAKPVWYYSRIKNLAIQHGIELEVGDWAREGDILGDLAVNEKTRQIVLGRIRIAYQKRQDAEVVQPGWTVALDGPQSDDDDFIAYKHALHPTRSLRQIFNTARVG